ncbi:hypothetical protein D9758_007054 [Tetrapyrgos nigripes]|uniref:Uncharacterized protein n=1 Tax=Tetrapyrgos nigripes TaxID=182062 RepID=A0A8H5GDK7_9AGAR|nr:hypothetical protein D9758_007054 [Tetrapyrgos nigripes]
MFIATLFLNSLALAAICLHFLWAQILSRNLRQRTGHLLLCYSETGRTAYRVHLRAQKIRDSRPLSAVRYTLDPSAFHARWILGCYKIFLDEKSDDAAKLYHLIHTGQLKIGNNDQRAAVAVDCTLVLEVLLHELPTPSVHASRPAGNAITPPSEVLVPEPTTTVQMPISCSSPSGASLSDIRV